jgi:hypothetical protein
MSSTNRRDRQPILKAVPVVDADEIKTHTDIFSVKCGTRNEKL